MNIDDKITKDQKRNFTSAFMSNLKTFYDHNFSKNKNIIYMLSHPWEFNNINPGTYTVNTTKEHIMIDVFEFMENEEHDWSILCEEEETEE